MSRVAVVGPIAGPGGSDLAEFSGVAGNVTADNVTGRYHSHAGLSIDIPAAIPAYAIVKPLPAMLQDQGGTAIDTSYVRTYMCPFGAAPGGTREILSLWAMTQKCALRLNQDGTLSLYGAADQLLGTTEEQLSCGPSAPVYRLELLCGTGANAAYELRIATGDGEAITVLSGTGNVGDSAAGELGLGSATPQGGTGVVIYSDIVWDDAGWPGITFTGLRRPVAYTDIEAGWSGGYQEVAEWPNDGDTTCIECSTAGAARRFGLGQLQATVGQIVSVEPFAVLRRIPAFPSTNMTIGIHSPAGSATATTTPGQTYAFRGFLSETDPGTGLPWVLDDLMQSEISVAAGSDTSVVVTAVGMAVEYTAARMGGAMRMGMGMGMGM